MPSLKSKILKTYLRLIIAFPLVILLLFNCAIIYFSSVQAEQNLERIQGYLNNIQHDDIASYFTLAIAKDLTAKTELVIYSLDGEILEDTELEENYISEKIAHKAYTKVTESNKITYFYDGIVRYYCLRINTKIENSPVIAMYISLGDFSNNFLYTVDSILLVSLLISTVIALYVSQKLALSIAKPIEEITHKLGELKTDEVLTISENQESYELSKLSIEVNQLSQRIYNHNQAQKKFFHNASHELRTPLMSIQGYAEGIREGVLKDNNNALNIIIKETKRISHIVDNLLLYSRIESLDHSKKFVKKNINNIISDNIQKIYGYAVKENIEIIFDNTQSYKHLVSEELLSKALLNILSNAVKHAKKKVNINIYREDDIIIEIIDDGDGICSSDLPYIFEMFYKGENGNFGLGLAIAKSALEKMNASITVKSCKGNTVFKILLRR